MPGTGKTQLARTLAREVGVELFEVTDNYRDGEPMEGSGRLTALRAAQHVLAQRRVLLVFDEMEDAFAGSIKSEEHTSELQSLMRISYAVFCLKKKKQKNNHN